MAIFFSYWLPSAGALTDTAAGIMGMKFKTFITYSVISSIFWDSLVGAIIYISGDKALFLAAPGTQGDVIVYLIGAIWIIALVVSDLRKKKSK